MTYYIPFINPQDVTTHKSAPFVVTATSPPHLIIS